MSGWGKAGSVNGLFPEQSPPESPPHLPTVTIPPVPVPTAPTLPPTDATRQMPLPTATQAATRPTRYTVGRKYEVCYTSSDHGSGQYLFLGSGGRYSFYGKGEVLITETAAVFTAERPAIRFIFSNKPLEIPLGDIGDVTSEGKMVRLSFRKNGKTKRFSFVALSEEEARSITAALPQGGLGELPHIQVQQSEFVTALNRATPNAFVTPLIIAVNVVIFLLMALSGAGVFTTNLDVAIRWGANYGPLTTDGQWWRLLTSAFLHFGILHIFFNMWALSGIGVLVEKLFGNYVYLGIYLVSAIVGSSTSLIWHADATVSAGASGAICGIYGALVGYLAIQRHSVPQSMLAELWKSTIAFVLYTLYFGLAHKGIDNAAHLGGLLGGVLTGMAFARFVNLELRDLQTRVKLWIGIPASCGLIVVALAFIPNCDSSDVNLVKTGHLSAYPTVPVEKAVKSFVGYPRWESGVASDGLHFVNVRGKIRLMEKEVEAVLQFEVNPRAKTFEVRALEYNGIPQNGLEQLGFLAKMFESYKN